MWEESPVMGNPLAFVKWPRGNPLASSQNAGVVGGPVRGGEGSRSVRLQNAWTMVLLKWKLFILSLALVGSGGTPRELRGWTAAGRNSRDSGGFTHGACAGSGKIIGSSQQDSLAGCEYTCAITPGCVWYAYCAAHREPALPADHQLELCNDQVICLAPYLQGT